ncbi:MAG: polysaccharide biosynthesis C-terminal domain-containing protein [Candidatus Krumholzibacteriota bacterium]
MKLVEAGAKILFSRVGQVTANAVVVLVVAKTLGPEGQGHYSLTVALAMLLAALLGGGMGLAAVPSLRQDKVPAVRMLKAQSIWAVGMVLLLLLTAWWSTGAGPADVLHRRLGWFSGLGFLAAVAATGFLGFEIFSYDLLARGRLVVGAAVNGGRAFVHLLVILALGLTGSLTFGRSVGVFAVAQLAGMLVMLVVLLREIRRPQPDTRTVSIREFISRTGISEEGSDEIPADLARRSLPGLILYNLRHGWLGQISAVAYFLLLRLDQGLLEYYRGAAEVGIYSIAVYVGEMLWLLPGALTPLLVHSSAAHASDPDRDRTAARAVRIGILLTTAVGLPLFFLAEPLLALLAGGEYQGSGLALRALLPGIVAFAPGVVLAGDFIGRGKAHWNTQASVLTVVVGVVAGVLLIPGHGPVGAAWASSIAYACGSAVMLVRFRQITRMSLRGLILGRM